MWAGISLFAMLFFARFDYHRLGKLFKPYTGRCNRAFGFWFWRWAPSQRAASAGLISVYPVPALRGGKNRSYYFSFMESFKKRRPVKKFATGLLPYLLVIGFVCGLIILEKHFSATMLVLLVSLGILFVAGARIPHLMALGLPVVMGAFVLVRTSEYRWKRCNVVS